MQFDALGMFSVKDFSKIVGFAVSLRDSLERFLYFLESFFGTIWTSKVLFDKVLLTLLWPFYKFFSSDIPDGLCFQNCVQIGHQPFSKTFFCTKAFYCWGFFTVFFSKTQFRDFFFFLKIDYREDILFNQMFFLKNLVKDWFQ